jgi:hypothetical protein
MASRQSTLHMALGTGALAMMSGCGLLVGLDHYRLEDAGGGGAGGQAATSGASSSSSTAATSGSTASSSGSVSVSSASVGVGGAGGAGTGAGGEGGKGKVDCNPPCSGNKMCCHPGCYAICP